MQAGELAAMGKARSVARAWHPGLHLLPLPPAVGRAGRGRAAHVGDLHQRRKGRGVLHRHRQASPISSRDRDGDGDDDDSNPEPSEQRGLCGGGSGGGGGVRDELPGARGREEQQAAGSAGDEARDLCGGCCHFHGAGCSC